MFEMKSYLDWVSRVCSTTADYNFTRPEIEIILEIVEKRHLGDGFFSMDGVFDDLVELLGDNEKSRRLYNAIV